MGHKFQGTQETQKPAKKSYYIASLFSTQSNFIQYSDITTLASFCCWWAEFFQISELSALSVFYQDDHGRFCLQVNDIFKGQISFDSFNYLPWGRNPLGRAKSLILIVKVILHSILDQFIEQTFSINSAVFTHPICGNNVKLFLLRKEHSHPDTSYLWTIVISQFDISFSSKDKKVIKYMECVKRGTWLRIYWNEDKFL